MVTGWMATFPTCDTLPVRNGVSLLTCSFVVHLE